MEDAPLKKSILKKMGEEKMQTTLEVLKFWENMCVSFEIFLNKFVSDTDFQKFIKANYFTAAEYLHKHSMGACERVFAYLLDVDYQKTISDPVSSAHKNVPNKV